MTIQGIEDTYTIGMAPCFNKGVFIFYKIISHKYDNINRIYDTI